MENNIIRIKIIKINTIQWMEKTTIPQIKLNNTIISKKIKNKKHYSISILSFFH